MAQTRYIENRGILNLTQEERSGKAQRLYTEVVQLPYSEYLNVKSNPSHGFYGYAVLMAKEFAFKKIPIEFHKQLLYLEERFDAQVGEMVVCNAMTLLRAIVIVSNQIPPDPKAVYLQPDLVEFPLWAVTQVKFVLVPGCVIKVEYAHEEYQKCPASPVVQPDLLPPPSLPTPPPSPPPEDTDDDQKIPLSPPYQGDDDGGDTFVRNPPEPEEPSEPPVGADCTKFYLITAEGVTTDSLGVESPWAEQARYKGEIVSVAPFYLAAFDVWSYRVTQKTCEGEINYFNMYSRTGMASLTGSHTIVEVP